MVKLSGFPDCVFAAWWCLLSASARARSLPRAPGSSLAAPPALAEREMAAGSWTGSQSKLIRIESGAVNISTNDLRALLAHYGVDSSGSTPLVAVGRAAREGGMGWCCSAGLVGPLGSGWISASACPRIEAWP